MILNLFSNYISISQEITQFLLLNGVNQNSVEEIPTGVDCNQFKPLSNKTEIKLLRNQLGISQKSFVYLFVGRLVKGKGIDTLLNAMKIVEKNIPACELLVIGDVNKTNGVAKSNTFANSVKEAQLKAKVMGLKNVKFTGFSNDVDKYMQACDAFIFPSLSEGLPNVVIEAMMSGLPIIASNIPGNTDLIQDGINGIIFQPNDYIGLARCMVNINNNKILAKQLSANGRKIALKNYEIDNCINKYLLLITGVV